MKKSQNDKVLGYLKTHEGITTMDAIRELGITRLSARIYDLRDMGYTIKASSKSGRSADGTPYTVAYYQLNEDLDNE